MTDILQTTVAHLSSIGKSRTELLQKELGIYTFQDLLNTFPFRYIDRTRFLKINEIQNNGSEVQIIGRLKSMTMVKQKHGQRMVATFQDETGFIELVWFQGYKWIESHLKINEEYVVFGKPSWFNGSFSIPHPEIDSKHDQYLRPSMQAVYPSTEKLHKAGVSNRVLSSYIREVFSLTKGNFQETLSEGIIQQMGLISKSQALLNIHFPNTQELLTQAQRRLKFEELFYVQFQLVQKKMMAKKLKGFVFEKVGDYFNTFYKYHLPFELTGAQMRVIKEIRRDMASGNQMNRLLQGDVGSGKTIVCVMAALMAIDNGFQACVTAPTEILATQHYTTFCQLLAGLNIKVEVLTGSTKVGERRKIFEDLKDGQLQILIGTHALLEDTVVFKNLGLAVIDEQHRFGVAQRSKIWHKNQKPPHVLVMSATPIPRTLAMSLYGDLDISTIDELPPGRKDIITALRYDTNRLSINQFIKDEIAKGRQAYVVYPLIKESETLDYKDLMDGYMAMERDFPKPKYQISIVHGKMKAADKDFEMDRFVKGETQIMMATTVIEVGVNVPNASVMIVESAERFGLSQLHQLRGRVGRGAEQSYCILVTGHKLSSEAKARLKTMVSTNDGFKIAEADLKLRGPGDLMGTQQSGVLNFKIADIVTDGELLKWARHCTQKVLAEDENLSKQEHLPIKQTYINMAKYRNIWNYIS